MGVSCSRRKRQLRGATHGEELHEDEWELIAGENEKFKCAVRKVLFLIKLRRLWAKLGASLQVNKRLLSGLSMSDAVRPCQSPTGELHSRESSLPRRVGHIWASLGRYLRAARTKHIFDQLRSVRGKLVRKDGKDRKR